MKYSSKHLFKIYSTLFLADLPREGSGQLVGTDRRDATVHPTSVGAGKLCRRCTPAATGRFSPDHDNDNVRTATATNAAPTGNATPSVHAEAAERAGRFARLLSPPGAGPARHQAHHHPDDGPVRGDGNRRVRRAARARFPVGFCK